MSRVLIIDAPASVARLRGVLDGEGFDVLEATTGEVALALAAKEPPDVVVLELDLPGALDGFDVIAKLLGRHPELPVVIFTSKPGGRASSLCCTAVACIEKSGGAEALVECLQRVLGWRERLLQGTSWTDLRL